MWGVFGGVLTLLLVTVGAAHAHTGGGAFAGGLGAGFVHPILGWDHVIAMVAVGLWGAFLGRPAIYLLPIVFPLIMAMGAVLGIVGVPLPSVEAGIAASAIVLGLLIAFAVRSPLWLAILIVGVFAVFHGHAHGTELPEASDPLGYAIGFVVATGLLHLCGIGFGLLVSVPLGAGAVRTGGAAICIAGLAFLFGLL